MNKEFLPFIKVRNNAIKLAAKIHNDGFIPDIIYVSLRGGAYMGNMLSEYFKFVRKHERPILYAAVVARSYTDIHQHGQVMVDGWTYDPEYLRAGDKILLVDDIFDSGRTINHLADIIIAKGIPREDIKIVVHDYKVHTHAEQEKDNHPDYYCRKHIINSPEEDIWIHYMSHELVGLSKDELKNYYYKEDLELSNVLEEIELSRKKKKR